MALVVITGGNRGIGRELARLYTEAGDRVVLGIRNPGAAGDLPGTALPLDVTDETSAAAFAAGLDGQPVNLLINNAGVMGPERQSVAEMDFAGFLDALNVNTLGPLRVTQALLPNLKQADKAKVAIISSGMGSMAHVESDHAAYRTSKAAANKVAQCLATELAQDGIAVAALHPGWVRTDMGGPTADLAPEESAAGLKAVLDGLSVETTGRFWNYDGAALAW